jgi:uncharacterized protein
MIHEIPTKALEQHVAILGKTGSGKTYAAKGTAERLLDAGSRVCVVDPTGVWWGLKSSASGKSAGFPVVVFGGSHADFPLGPNHGEAVAEIIGAASTSVIVDTSLLRVGERTRFFADFADALLRKNRGPLHLFIDEAHVFAPQGKVADPQSGAMLHAANNLVSLGRSRGFRIVLISQRPAKLHKDALTQVEALVAMRVIAPQDRAAVQEWIKDNADATKAQEIIASLATLKTGHGWVWAPELAVLERVQFPKIRTLDSSSAPTDAGERSGPVLAPIDRSAIEQRLQSVAAEIVANDPAKLRAELAAVRRELAQAKSAKPLVTDDELAVAYQRGYREGTNFGMNAGWCSYRDEMLEALTKLPDTPKPIDASYLPRAPQMRTPAPAVSKAAAPRATNNVDLPRGEVAVLSACIQFAAGLRREQLTVLTGYKKSSRDTYIQRLRERGYLEIKADLVRATDDGVSALPDASPLPTGAELQQYWLEKLPAGERAILELLIERYPHAVTRDEISSITEYRKSSRDTYLQRMSAKQLIEEPQRGAVRASEALFR